MEKTVNVSPGKQAVGTISFINCESCGCRLKVEDGRVVEACDCQKDKQE